MKVDEATVGLDVIGKSLGIFVRVGLNVGKLNVGEYVGQLVSSFVSSSSRNVIILILILKSTGDKVGLNVGNNVGKLEDARFTVYEDEKRSDIGTYC